MLAIVAHEQPVTRADMRTMREVDSDAVVDTLTARKFLEEDPPFGGRGASVASDHDLELLAALQPNLAARPSAAPARSPHEPARGGGGQVVSIRAPGP